MDVDQLPTYDPRSNTAKNEAASRADLARTLIHLVPIVMLLCSLLLWSLSNTNSVKCPLKTAKFLEPNPGEARS
uniref:Uncharacterized protein n=1 Tax=Setaria italica TaxID=4555 RepID=K3XQA0_SETIT